LYFAGPSLLAMILVGKFGDDLPLNRQSAAFAREGGELGVSTLADWVGGCVAALDPILSQRFSRVVGCETRRIRAVAIYRKPLRRVPPDFDRSGRG
jgi:transposase